MIEPIALVQTTNTKGLIPLEMAVLANIVKPMVEPSTITIEVDGTISPKTAMKPISPPRLSLPEYCFCHSVSLLKYWDVNLPIHSQIGERKNRNKSVTLHEKFKLLETRISNSSVPCRAKEGNISYFFLYRFSVMSRAKLVNMFFYYLSQ